MLCKLPRVWPDEGSPSVTLCGKKIRTPPNFEFQTSNFPRISIFELRIYPPAPSPFPPLPPVKMLGCGPCGVRWGRPQPLANFVGPTAVRYIDGKDLKEAN